MSLFGRGKDKAAETAAAAAEAQRLCALPSDELAIKLIGALAPTSEHKPEGCNVGELITWPMSGFRSPTRYVTQLRGPTEEGLQLLETAGLVVRTLPGPNGWVKLTRAGEMALAENAVRQRLTGSSPT